MSVKTSKLLFQTGLVFLFILPPALLLYHGNPLDHMPGRDNGVFLYGGQQLLAGKTPYVDFWDHKGPLIYFINALGLWLGKGLRWGVWGVEFAFLFSTAAGIYRVSREAWGKASAIIAVLCWFFALGQVGHYKYFHDTNYTETYSLLFNVASIYFWAATATGGREKLNRFTMGITTGLSLLLRPNNIGIQASLILVDLITAMFDKDWKAAIRKTLFFMFGLASTLAVCAMWFAARDALPDMLDAVFNYNMYYAQKNQVKGFITSYAEMFNGGVDKLGWLPVAAYAILLVIWLYKAFRKKTFPADHRSGLELAVLICLPLETIMSAISGRVFFHYFIIWTPSLAFLAGALGNEIFARVEKSLPNRRATVNGVLLAASLFALVISNLPAFAGYTRIVHRLLVQRTSPPEAETAIIQYVKDATQPTDTVLVWGNDVWINFLTDRASPTRYSYQFPLFMPGYTNQNLVLEFLDDLKNSPPTLIVETRTDTAEMLPLNPSLRAAATYAQVKSPPGMIQVFEYVGQNYCIVKEFHDTIIYRLKDGSVCR